MGKNIGNAQVGDLVKAWHDNKDHHCVGYLKGIKEGEHLVGSFAGEPGWFYYPEIEKIYVKEPVYRLKPLRELLRRMVDFEYEPHREWMWLSETVAQEVGHSDLCKAKK